MTKPRVLTRPKHGWASTRAERVGSRLSAGPPLIVLFCFASVLGISVFGSTITLIHQLLG